MAASASLTLEDGMRTVSCMATLALRTRVNMSAIGSVIVIPFVPPLPAGLGHTRHLAGVSELAQADAAQSELAEHRMGPSAATAAGIRPHLVLGFALRLDDERFLGHVATALHVGTGSRTRRAEPGRRHWIERS